jgi:hypothetical protein
MGLFDILLNDCVNPPMSFNTNNIKRLGNQVSVPMQSDDDGYFGRECPVEECLGYFKVTPGTGIQGPAPCHCPYCGHSGGNDTFWTQEQLDYAHSFVLRQVTDALHKDMKSMEFDHKPRGMFGIGISLKVTQSAPHPIKYYREKELETHVVCENCTLRYAIYGVFGWCPDCGIHNSVQILAKNFELARKELALAEAVEKDLADHLIGDALENIVSAFDGFGRELSMRKGTEIRFQNLHGARRNVQEKFGFDFAYVLTALQWQDVCRVFQKRHLLAHKMGVIDDDYVQKASDPEAVAGRKVHVNSAEVNSSIEIIELLGRSLFAGILPPAP